jgi:hypothetical protein
MIIIFNIVNGSRGHRWLVGLNFNPNPTKEQKLCWFKVRRGKGC